jgi:putative selenium metabolism protein SsnA
MTLLKNITCVTLSPPSVNRTDLRIRDGRIAEQGKNLTPSKGETVCDLNGKIVMPGFVCAHTHLYSSLSRGMPPPAHRPENFLQILREVWWKLDRALDEETIYYSAMAGALDAIMCGTTTLVDHHSSPRMIGGSLDIIKEALEETGLRGLLCYEVTDRGGRRERDRGLAENERFIRSNRRSRTIRGLVGAHAAFTLSEDSLRRCGELASHLKTGVHIHLAEDRCDAAAAREDYRCGVVDRLSNHGILLKQSILAHCIHVPARDFTKLHLATSWLVHNPRSNMNNAVGRAPVHLFGDRAALGTDGFPADMFEEARTAFLNSHDSEQPGPDIQVPELLGGGQRMISELFGERFGSFEKGSAADLIVIDYDPPTPLSIGNLPGHFLFGMRSSMVESVMVRGKWVMKERETPNIDRHAISEKARLAARKLWDIMGKL